ncbi:MAG: agmatinase [Bacillota bacterium]|nr:agmatinase [Bacillota bacterium]
MLDNSRLLEDSWLRWSADTIEEAKVAIMGIPFDNAVSFKKGAAFAPEKIRELSVELSDVADDFIPIKDGVLYDIGDILPELNWENYFADVKERALDLMQSGKFCLFIGGDHSVTIPLHKAFGEANKGKKIGIIHFDAHFDLCKEYDGHKWSHACTEARALDDVISGDDLFFIGVRVAELQELDMLKENPGIRNITPAQLEKMGTEAAFDELFDAFKDYDAIYLTLDIDVLDPAYAPGTGTPVSGGISSRQFIDLTRLILDRLPVKAMDIVEVAPPIDINDITSWAALRIIHQVFTRFSK